MSFFLSLLSMMTVFEAKVQWIWDFIEIPLYEAIEDYRYLPEAKLYLDGFWVVGAEVIYTRNGVERTFISTVNTSIVRNYTIYYKATFPDYNLSSIHPIIFSVVDQIPPVIYEIPEKTMMVGGAFPSFIEGITYGDNYDDFEDLVLTFQTSHITKDIVGTYQYGVIVTDRSGNQTKRVGTLHIIDLIPPVITQKKECMIDVFSSWNLKDYFTISDNADTYLEIILEDSRVDYQKIGIYPITISVVDDSDNITTISTEIKIVDREAPLMTLVPTSPMIDVFSDIDASLLKSYILFVQDNYDDLTVDDVHVIGVVNTDILGTYRLIYELKDSSLNTSQMSLDIKVVDRTPPEILQLESLMVDVWSVEPFWLEYFQISDNYSPLSELSIVLSTKPKMDVIGFYPITITVTDKSLNKAIYQSFIEVVDRTPPTITQLNDLLITDFEKHNYEHYFFVEDQYFDSEEITLFIDDSAVNYSQIGEYPIFVYASDPSGNESLIETELWLVDIIQPTLTLTHDDILIPYGDNALKLLDFVSEAYDNYDDLSIEDVLIIGEVNVNKIGVYPVMFELRDRSDNLTYATLIVRVDDLERPTLRFDDLIVIEGAMIDPLEGIEGMDNVSNPAILCLNSHIDDYLPGRHVLTYVVMDSRGNYQIYERVLIIAPIDRSISLIQYVPVILITVLGLIASIFTYRYYK